MATTVVIVRLSVPSYPAEWPNNPIRRNTVRFGIQLAPFAGIAVLSTVTLRLGILPRWVGS